MRCSMLTVLVTALAAGSALAVPAEAAAPTVELQPQRLTRGADVAVPHIDDGDFVDGARRVELPGTVARVIGEAGGGWLVATNNVDRKRNRRVVRVEVNGSVVEVLRNIDTSSVILSADGSTLAWQAFVGGGRKTVTYVASAGDGTLIAERGPERYVTLLDVDATRLVLGADRRTLQWRFTTSRSRTIVKKSAGIASIEHDLLTIYTRDPYLGGCTKLVRLSDPRDVVWKSCRDRVASFSPDGARMLTFHILTDGLGPGEIHQREIHGTRLATWTTNWFSGWDWESPTTVLLDVNGNRKAATVRCTLDSCENVTDPMKVPVP